MDDRTTDKMWLVKHLEVTRQLVIEDLRVIKVWMVNLDHTSSHQKINIS